MFIKVNETPNPNTLKFVLEQDLMKEGYSAHFIHGDNTAQCPIAHHLFQITGVHIVFLAGNFISVTKQEDMEWAALKTLIMSAIMDHIVAKYPIVLDSFYDKSDEKKELSVLVDDEMNLQIVRQIKDIIEQKIRPAVAEDGGDIFYSHFRDGIVYLEMRGACSGCPSSSVTLKSGIERMLKHYIPEVISVESI